MDYKDYYKILGVDKKASQEEIKKAYHKLARQYHPDLNPDNKKAEERFKEVNEAFEVLGDPENRKKYDTLGANWQQYQQFNSQGNPFEGFAYSTSSGPFSKEDSFFGGDVFSDFFQSFFGQERGNPQSKPEMRASLSITLEDAYKGGQKVITYKGKQYKVNLRPGIKNDQILVIKNVTGDSPNQIGDLKLKIKIQPHNIFERNGNDLHCELPVDLYTAVLGGEIYLDFFDGKLKIPIASGSQNGQSLRLRGKGMPTAEAGLPNGNLFVKLKVDLPKNLSPEEKALWEQLRDLRTKVQA